MPDVVWQKTHRGSLAHQKIVGKNVNKDQDVIPKNAPHWQTDSYQPPYRRTVVTTGYGLNEPQWSEGPPPLIFEKSPYSRMALPPLSATPITIHPLLAFHPITPIIWQIRDMPNNATLASHIRKKKYFHWLSLPAFEPSSVSSITIRLEPFDRPSVIFASDTAKGITIGDVLMAVYKAARAGATRIFCEQLKIDMNLLAPVIQRYGEMASQDTGSITGDDTVSFSVAQYMNFRTVWAGLTPSTKECDIWILHTKKSGV